MAFRSWAAPFAAGTSFATYDGPKRSQSNTTAESQGQKIDKGAIAKYIDDHAEKKSRGKCAAYCRLALEAGGVNTKGHPKYAKDYGPLLIREGASIVSTDRYQAKKGDIAVFDGSKAHPAGHITIFDGSNWVSDFTQKRMSPYRPKSTPPVNIYRFPDDE